MPTALFLLLRDMILRLGDGLAAALVASPDSAEGRVLLIRLDKLGDYVVWLDSARYLCAEFHARGSTVTLLANEEWANLARTEPCFDEVWGTRVRKLRRNPWYRSRLIARIRRRGFQTVYSLRVAKERALEDSLVRASAAQERVGITGVSENLDVRRLKRAERAYTTVAKVDPSIRSERFRNEHVLHQLGYSSYRAAIPPINAQSSHGRLTGQAPYAAIVPGGSWPGRRWPKSRFAEVIDHLWEAHGLRSVIIGSPMERDLGKYLARRTASERIIDLVGRLDLTELPGVLASATLVLTNETGPAHLAVACGTNTVCVAGGGHFGRFVPDPLASVPSARPQLFVVNVELACYGCNWHCPFIRTNEEVPPCISDVSLAAVIDAVDRAMEGVRGVRSSQIL